MTFGWIQEVVMIPVVEECVNDQRGPEDAESQNAGSEVEESKTRIFVERGTVQ